MSSHAIDAVSHTIMWDRLPRTRTIGPGPESAKGVAVSKRATPPDRYTRRSSGNVADSRSIATLCVSCCTSNHNLLVHDHKRPEHPWLSPDDRRLHPRPSLRKTSEH